MPPAPSTVAVVLPPREGFGPAEPVRSACWRGGWCRRPGFQTIVFGGKQDGPVFPDIDFRPVSPTLWRLGNTNVRYAAAVANVLRTLKPALVEVHNRPEIALDLGRAAARRSPVTVILNNDPQDMREASHAGRTRRDVAAAGPGDHVVGLSARPRAGRRQRHRRGSRWCCPTAWT